MDIKNLAKDLISLEDPETAMEDVFNFFYEEDEINLDELLLLFDEIERMGDKKLSILLRTKLALDSYINLKEESMRENCLILFFVFMTTMKTEGDFIFLNIFQEMIRDSYSLEFCLEEKSILSH